MFRAVVSSICAFTLVVGLGAGDLVRDRQQTSEPDSEKLARGKETLAACIATKCARLDLDNMRLDDFSVLNNLTHVDALMISRTNFVDLDTIKDLAHLKELHISTTDVRDLSGLSNFPNLTVFHFENRLPDVDMSPVSQLPKLSDLAIGWLDEGFDASFIQDMLDLENLTISWRGEADLSILQGHPSLKNISINGIMPSDQDALLTMPKLENLWIYHENSLNPAMREALEGRNQLRPMPAVVVC